MRPSFPDEIHGPVTWPWELTIGPGIRDHRVQDDLNDFGKTQCAPKSSKS